MARVQYRIHLVPAQPFTDWLYEQRERILKDETLADCISKYGKGNKILADRLGVTDRALRRYLKGHDGNEQPTDTFLYNRVADMLETAGVAFYEIYPDYEPPGIEGEIFCPECRDDVPAIKKRCAWCGARAGRRPRGLHKTKTKQRISDEQLRLLHELHVRWRLPIYDLARRSWQRFGYKSPSSCDEAIRRGWKRLGLVRLSDSQIMRAVAARRRRVPPLDEEQMQRVVVLHVEHGVSVQAIARLMVAESEFISTKWLGHRLRGELKARQLYQYRRRSETDLEMAA